MENEAFGAAPSLKPGATVAVIGAGVMGIGIAQVAAQAGHPVRLLDARAGAAAAAIARMEATLDGSVAKGRMSRAECDGVLARLKPADALAELADAALAIEVIVEQLAPKQVLLRELEALLAPEAILATNTSSISVTAIATGLKHPQRVVGLHFFNPAPLMKLVEVVSGAETSPAVARAMFELAQRWGKTPVHARSTPGFIVNRIARPYYAEALALLQEQAATPQALDHALRAAGFRLGPGELMDLIGHDVNFAVTQSVFEANFGDRRYMPSLVQKALLDGGRLGRKSGRGFYVSSDGAATTSQAVGAGTPAVGLAPISLAGKGALVNLLAERLTGRGIAFTRGAAADWSGLQVGAVQVHLSRGVTAAQLAAERRHAELAVMDWPLHHASADALALAFARSTSDSGHAEVRALWAALGWTPLLLRDVPGLVVARTVAMLVNEAADAVWQGVCSEPDADMAMKLGVNYPAGPFEWMALLGAPTLVALLDGLYAAYRSERYRVSPLLQQRHWEAKLIQSA